MQIKLKQAIYDLYTGILILYAMYESNYDEERGIEYAVAKYLKRRITIKKVLGKIKRKICSK